MEKEKNSKNIMDYATVTLLDEENAIEIIDQTHRQSVWQQALAFIFWQKQ